MFRALSKAGTRSRGVKTPLQAHPRDWLVCHWFEGDTDLHKHRAGAARRPRLADAARAQGIPVVLVTSRYEQGPEY